MRCTRSDRVSKDFTSTHALNGLSDGPVWRTKGLSCSLIYFSEPKIAPPSTRPWPSICLVAEYMTISAPCANGFCKIGDAITLSTMTSAPTRCASSEIIWISTSWSMGFDGVSRKTTLVSTWSALAQRRGSFPVTNSTVTPHLGKISFSTTQQELNIEAAATTRSPEETREAIDANIADIPLPVPTHICAPSIAAKRFSNIATVGFAKRP